MTRQQQAEASRAALVAAARACFTESGYDATTVAEVLRRAGMARGALYHYFPGGKAELFAAVYDDVDSALHAELDRIDGTRSPLAALRAGIAVYLRLCTQPDFASVVVRDAPRVVPDQEWAQSVGGSGRSFRRMREALDAALAAGEIAPCDTALQAAAVYGATRELGAHVIGASRPARAAAEATRAMDRMLDGIAVAPPPSRARHAPSARRTTRTPTKEHA
ncbi:MAG: TetR family transcriptional regulator [Frankiales bacterium]|nr:TetR family transcriptional regulator [Frankiales bacterium]